MTQEELIQALRKKPSWELQYLLDAEASVIRRLGNDKRAVRRHGLLFALAKRELSLRGELQRPDMRGFEDELGFDIKPYLDMIDDDDDDGDKWRQR